MGRFSLKLRKCFSRIKVVNEDHVCYRVVNKDNIHYMKGRKFLPQIIEAVMGRGNMRRFLPLLSLGQFST